MAAVGGTSGPTGDCIVGCCLTTRPYQVVNNGQVHNISYVRTPFDPHTSNRATSGSIFRIVMESPHTRAQAVYLERINKHAVRAT
jgi:hypothetical protein